MGSLDPQERAALMRVARVSIDHGLERGAPLLPEPGDFSPALREPGAVFVTLEREGALRGCVGSLEARRPLVVDTAHNAFAAAFHDPRFEPLSRAEGLDLEIHLSVLGPPEVLVFESEAELVAQLRPGVDGLIIEDRGCRATFLPAVWEKVPDAGTFLRELKRKAGLVQERPSRSLRAWRYSAESVD
jgi:hypothetical protein